MSQQRDYEYLLADYWSFTKLPFIKDPRKIRADFIYGQSVGADARTPEELAVDFNLPLEAVAEAIHYCMHNLEFVQQERARENAHLDEYEQRHPSLRPAAGQ